MPKWRIVGLPLSPHYQSSDGVCLKGPLWGREADCGKRLVMYLTFISIPLSSHCKRLDFSLGWGFAVCQDTAIYENIVLINCVTMRVWSRTENLQGLRYQTQLLSLAASAFTLWAILPGNKLIYDDFNGMHDVNFNCRDLDQEAKQIDEKRV